VKKSFLSVPFANINFIFNLKVLSVITICLGYIKTSSAANLQCHEVFDYSLHEVSLEMPLNPSQIYYKTFGDPKNEALIMIHGLDSASVTFYKSAQILSSQYFVITYDQRGHGQTQDIGTNYSTRLLAQDLKVLIDYLGVKKAHILGHSLGARTAIRFVELFPSYIQSIIIEDMEMLQRFRGSVDEFRKNALKLRQFPMHYISRNALIDALRPFYGSDAESLSYRRARENNDGTIDLLFRPYVSVLYGSQSNSEDLTSSFTNINKPVLILQADPQKGSAISEMGMDHLVAIAPHAKVVTIFGATHNIQGSQEGRFIDELLIFLNENKLKNSEDENLLLSPL
jgi:pimeloyl-ACP methyl ester carboxylesterase